MLLRLPSLQCFQVLKTLKVGLFASKKATFPSCIPIHRTSPVELYERALASQGRFRILIYVCMHVCVGGGVLVRENVEVRI